MGLFPKLLVGEPSNFDHRILLSVQTKHSNFLPRDKKTMPNRRNVRPAPRNPPSPPPEIRQPLVEEQNPARDEEPINQIEVYK